MIKYGKLNTSGVYKITCTITNEFYIGSSVNMNNRYRHHKHDLNYNIHANVNLQRLWNEYNENRFTFEVIEYCNKEVLRDREQYYIDMYKDSGFLCNVSIDSKSIMGGRKHTEESKKKMSNSVKGEKHHQYGKHLSEEHREKIRKSSIGKPHRKRIEIPQDFTIIYEIWKSGKITAIKAMEMLNLKKTTFYKIVKEYENKLVA